jgi:hypothetical protein
MCCSVHNCYRFVYIPVRCTYFPLLVCAINIGGALYLCDHIGKIWGKIKKENATPSGSNIMVDLVFYKHAIPSGLVSEVHERWEREPEIQDV